MLMKKKLGKGFDALLQNTSIGDLQEAAQDALVQLPIEQIAPNPFQPRKVFSESALGELAQSIKTQGLLQPIVVRRVADKYQLIAGERRWRAAQRIPLHTIDAVIKDASDEQVSLLALLENIQREDLNVIELAEGMKRLVDTFTLTHQQIADGIGHSRASVTNLLRILQLSEESKAHLVAGDIELGHAKLLITRSADEQLRFCRAIIENNMTVRTTERMIADYDAQNNKDTLLYNDTTNACETQRLEKNLSAYFGQLVRIKEKNGKGTLMLNFATYEQFDALLAQCGIPRDVIEE